jgi:SulP family sulfate permease
MIEEAATQPRAMLIDLGAQDKIDLTSIEVLKGLVKDLKSKGIAMYLADVHMPVREFSQRAGLLEIIGEDHIYPTVDAAVRFLEAADE